MGGKKKDLQNKSEQRSRESVEQEQAGAANLRTELQKRRDILGTGLPESLEAARTGATNLRDTGGITAGIGSTTAGVGAVPQEKIDTSGRGFEGYEELSKTGGFKPGESEQFLRRATAPTAAIYGANRDELSRRQSLQGGYMPGFGASAARLTRQGAQAGAEASLSGNLELNKQIREGKLSGLSGMERIRGEAEKERLSRQELGQKGRIAEEELRQKGSIAEGELAQRGKIAGQELLQKYTQFGAAALNEVDVNDLRNRLQSGNISQSDSQLLAQLSAQNKTLFDNIMQGVSAVGGATAGILTGVGGLGKPTG